MARSRIIATVSAAALILAIAAPASAASITESLSVNSVLTVTGVPASINYGAVDPGGQSGQQSFTASVTSNNPWTFKMSGSDFTGPATIGKAARQGQLGLATGSVGSMTPGGWTAFDQPAFDGTTVNATGTAGSGSFNVDLRVNVPANAPGGAYSGTITYTFSAS